MLYVAELKYCKDMINYNDNFNKSDNKEKSPVYDSFFDSVEEEIRKENYQRLWNKYGKLISTVVAISLLGVTGYSFWQKHDLAEKEAISAQFTIAQNKLNSGQTDSALAHFREMGKCNKKNYATMAKFEYAGILLEKRDKKAITEYKSICDNEKSPELYRDLAYIYYINASLDLLAEKEIKIKIPEFIKELSSKYVGKKWNLLALESLGYCYLKAGNYLKAKTTFSDLAKSEKIPDAMLERTREIILYIDQQIGTPDLEVKTSNNRTVKQNAEQENSNHVTKKSDNNKLTEK